MEAQVKRRLRGVADFTNYKFLNFTVTIGRPSARASALSVGRGVKL